MLEAPNYGIPKWLAEALGEPWSTDFMRDALTIECASDFGPLQLKLKGNFPAIALAVDYICQEYRTALEDVRRLGFEDTAAKRLGRLLVKLGNLIGVRLETGKVRFPLILTQEELGSMVSISREPVTRILSDFRERGWIDITDSLVTLEWPEYL